MLSTTVLIWLPLLLPLADPTVEDVLAEARKQAAPQTQAALEAATASLEKATEKFGGDARVHAELSELYSELAYFGYAKPYDMARKAKAAASKAIELNDASPEGHTALGIVQLYYDWDFPKAEASFKKAIGKKADFAPARTAYARCLVCLGKLKEAEDEAKKAVDLTPQSAAARIELGRVHFASGAYDKAAEQFAKANELVPTSPVGYVHLGLSQIKQSKKIEALESLAKAAEVSGREVWTVARLGAGRAIAGKRVEGAEALGEVSSLAGEKFLSGFDMALLYAGIGEKETASTWLEKAVEERAPRLIDLRYDPFFYRLHSELRFKDLLRQMNLPELQAP